LDFAADNLPELKRTIDESYPDVSVTTIQADAADEAAIAGVCKQALADEGRLDVFFANVGSDLCLVRAGNADSVLGRNCELHTLPTSHRR
jgi:NADP-dependent 3-hydroxy acid dehydrogenase YdfG